MKSNNPFKTHGIEHLSPSKINLWVADPALFIGTYLCGMKGSFGVGAFRGTAYLKTNAVMELWEMWRVQNNKEIKDEK